MKNDQDEPFYFTKRLCGAIQNLYSLTFIFYLFHSLNYYDLYFSLDTSKIYVSIYMEIIHKN